MIRSRDWGILAVIIVIPGIIFGGLFILGRSLYWGDLTYIHYPWRALTAEMLQAGALPLWDRYAYLGMPLAAQMQSAVWYPGTLLFYLMSFAGATAVFHAVHYGLAGAFVFLWLRREGFLRSGAFAGAMAFMGSGILVSRVPFLNHLSTLAYLPAFFLFNRNRWLLSLSFALAFLSGYPLMLAGGILSAYLLSKLLSRHAPSESEWLLAGVGSMVFSACLLFPAIGLAVHSHRGAGMGLEDTLQFGLNPGDLVQFFSPLFLQGGGFSPTLFWWKTCYFGLLPWAFAGLAYVGLKRRQQVGIGAYLLLAVILILGGSTTVSKWFWEYLPALKYVRYPGNLTYLLLPVLAWLVAAGLLRRSWAWHGAGLLVVELGVYLIGSQPTVPRNYYTDPGTIVRELQSPEMSSHRYLLSPRALEWHRGVGSDFGSASLDLKHRLYGLTNLPYHLSAASGFGEPLVPADSYAFMDFIYGRPGIDSAASYLPWADVSLLLTREKFPSKQLKYAKQDLWHLYGVPGRISRAMWFSETDGADLPEQISGPGNPPDIGKATPLPLERDQEDRFHVSGHTQSGWLYLAEPRVSGWNIWLNGRRASAEPAMGAFQKIKVPKGDWSLYFRYDPSLWRVGLLVTLLGILAASAYWYNRTVRMSI